MGKVKLNARLISDEDNLVVKTNGIKTKNKIVYKENENITVTILLLDNKIELNRKCEAYDIKLFFDKNSKVTMSKYTLFGMNKVFDLETITNEFNVTNKKIDIKYELEGSKFHYLLKIGGIL